MYLLFERDKDTNELMKSIRAESIANAQALKDMGIKGTDKLSLGSDDSIDYLYENSSTESGSMEEPEFGVIYTSIKKMQTQSDLL